MGNNPDADAPTIGKAGLVPVATRSASSSGKFRRASLLEKRHWDQELRSHRVWNRVARTCSVFPNVAQSRTYVENGLYHYRTLPSHAKRFRVAW